MKKHNFTQIALEMTHDIKSPLAKIKAISMILSSKVQGRDLVGYVNRMEEATSRLDHSLNVLFDFLALSEAKPMLTYEFFDLNEVISLVIESCEREGFLISYKSDQHLKYEIMGDRNLVKIAIGIIFRKAVQKNSTKRPLMVSIESNHKTFCVCIEDRKGMEEEKGIEMVEKLLVERIIGLHKGKIFQKKDGKISYACIVLPKRG